MSKNEQFGFWCSMPGLIAILALMVYPLLYTVIISFMRYDNIQPVVFVGFKNYRWFFSYSDSSVALKVSVVYSLGTTSLAFILALILAHSLHKIKKGGSLFRTLLILPWAAPLVISGLIWRWMLDKDIGVINYILLSLRIVRRNIAFLSQPRFAMLSGIVTASWCYIPFLMVLILAGLESIPEELYEVAQIDGASHIQRFWYISLSLNKPQMIIAYLIVLMFTFRTPDTFFSLTAGGPAKSTYHAGLFLMDSIYRYLNFGHAAAISMILLIICLGFALPILYYGIIRRGK